MKTSKHHEKVSETRLQIIQSDSIRYDSIQRKYSNMENIKCKQIVTVNVVEVPFKLTYRDSILIYENILAKLNSQRGRSVVTPYK